MILLKENEDEELGGSDKIKITEEWVNQRWPTRVFYGKQGELSHPYSRIKTPNIKRMTCHYRCKSYRTFKCDAKLKLKVVGGPTGESEWTLSGGHSEICRSKNGIATTTGESISEVPDKREMTDLTEKFKNRLTELAVEKIWLAPMKIWSMVREETVAAEGGGALRIPSSDMVSAAINCVQLYIING